MSRVYLFADFGEGPVAVQQWRFARTAIAARGAGWPDPTARRMHDAANPPGAWWLVECESADAGRELIAEHVACGAVGSDVKHGRVLASGGAAKAEELNPYYVAYARAHGRSPGQQSEFDLKAYPGGQMAGFILWIGEQKRAFAAAHPESVRRGHDIVDQDAWTRWLEAIPEGGA